MEEPVPAAEATPVELPEGMRFVTRKEWGAKPPHSVRLLQYPMGHVCFSYNIGTEPCNGDDECFRVLREAQTNYMNNGLSDIPYNFLVGGDGTVYEGRGWRVTSSSTMGNTQSSRLDIAFIGNFEQDLYYMLDAALEFTYYGVDKKYVAKGFNVIEKHNGIYEKLMGKIKAAEEKKKQKEPIPKKRHWKYYID